MTCPLCHGELLSPVDRRVQRCCYCGLDWLDSGEEALVWGPKHPSKEVCIRPGTQPWMIAESNPQRIQLARGILIEHADGVQHQWHQHNPPRVYCHHEDVLFVHP